MKTKYYFSIIITLSLFLIACNNSDSRKEHKPEAEVKNILSNDVKGVGADYVIDLSDTSTFTTTCGKIIPSWWSVKNDSCMLYTPYIIVQATSGTKIYYSFRVNQSGNLEVTDNTYIQYQVDNGDWVTDTVLCGEGSPAVRTRSGSIGLNYGHYIRFRIVCETNDNTEFWAIADGDMTITDGDDSISLITYSNGKPPDPPDTNPYLPIELISFTGNADAGSVILKWSTASEINNDFFTVERSEDGVSFNSISNIDGAGNSNSILQYSFEDRTPFSSTFYRLKQTDYNGSYSYSQIIKVSVNEEMENEISVNSYNGTIYIMTDNTEGGSMAVYIYALDGKLVYSKINSIDNGSNTISFIPEIQRKSIYIISARLNNDLPKNSKIYFD